MKTKILSRIFLVSGGFLAIVVLCLAFLALKLQCTRANVDAGDPLYIGWEGLIKDTNFRDVGTSINACAGRELLQEGRIFRANKWFSGWSCKSIGNPDIIFSLNFDPLDPEVYYCSDSQRTVVGVNMNQAIVLNDLEFLETWNNFNQRSAACRYIRSIISAVVDGKRILIHCEAGRDRTGAVSALLSALVLEDVFDSREDLGRVLECDYRKSSSLKENKFGRIARLIDDIRNHETIKGFVSRTCEISESEISLFANSMRGQ